MSDINWSPALGSNRSFRLNWRKLFRLKVAITLLLIALATWGIRSLFPQWEVYSVGMDDAGGLRAGCVVVAQGLEVGEVLSVKRSTGPWPVVAEIRVRKGVQIPKHAEIKIEMYKLVGKRAVYARWNGVQHDFYQQGDTLKAFNPGAPTYMMASVGTFLVDTKALFGQLDTILTSLKLADVGHDLQSLGHDLTKTGRRTQQVTAKTKRSLQDIGGQLTHMSDSLNQLASWTLEHAKSAKAKELAVQMQDLAHSYKNLGGRVGTSWESSVAKKEWESGDVIREGDTLVARLDRLLKEARKGELHFNTDFF